MADRLRSALTLGFGLAVTCAYGCGDTDEEPPPPGDAGSAGMSAGAGASGGKAGGSGNPTGGGAGKAQSSGGAGASAAGGDTQGAGTAGAAGRGAGGTSGGSGGNGASGASSGSTSAGSGGAVDAGTCQRAVGACTAPTTKITDVELGVPATGYGREGDTEPLPFALAALPAGGSRLAWLGTDDNVHIAELDCDDNLVGTPFAIPAIDLQDLHADADGGVVLVTREATGGGTDQCGEGLLCGGESSPCREMVLVRFDSEGEIVWETQVTNLSDTLQGYENGARFVWWYQHHGRIAFDGENYAAYFGVAITVDNADCVDIHEGDRMQVVSSTGELLTGHDSFEVGCSHSWTTRIVWDERTGHFVMVCATDNDCRIARPNPYRTIAAGECDGTLFGGDLVLSSHPGYWTAWSQGETIRLQHFTDEGPDDSVDDAGDSSHPHLVAYGPGHMLLSWASGSTLTARVRETDASAAPLGESFTLDVEDHDYLAFKAYPDGSAAYAAAGENETSAKIARVLPCQ